jgi:RNA polymerase sigma-70 factor, ECF subfamily
MTLAEVYTPADDGDDRRAELEESFRLFLQDAYPKLRKFLLRLCFDSYLAEDALQEALIVAMARWESIRTHEEPITWVKKIAWHKLLTLDDKQQWKKQVPLDLTMPDPGEPSGPLEAAELLRQVLARLPYRQRAVFALMIEGDEDEQIADQLGLALTTVRTYKCEARKLYREMFRDGGAA